MMPSALLKQCSARGGCGELVVRGLCPVHAAEAEQRRGSAASRGYDASWRRFRDRFKNALIAAGIAPVCGAALPGGPRMTDSLCRAVGHLNAGRLHLDHDPPLRSEERRDRRAVQDLRRCGFLCEACHNRKTQLEQQMGLV